jgi:hypothetical protein
LTPLPGRVLFNHMDNTFIAKKLVEHDEQLNRIEAKIDGGVTKDMFLTAMDKLTTAIERLDQERLFEVHRLDRVEADVATLKKRSA